MEYHKGPAALGLQGKPKTNAKMLEEAGVIPVRTKQEQRVSRKSVVHVQQASSAQQVPVRSDMVYTHPQKKRSFSEPIFPGDPGSLTLTPGHVHFVKWS